MIFLSSIAGYFSGIIPGIHVNTIIPALLMLDAKPVTLTAIIVSFSVSQIFSDYLTSVYFGIPDVSNPLNVLPAHRLTMKGRGYEAFKLSIIGVLGSILITIIITFLIMPVFPSFYSYVRQYVLYLILFVVFYTLLTEQNITKIAISFVVFLLSGLLGLLVLNTSLVPRTNSLLPMLTGFFGLSQILVSLFEKSKLPKQKTDEKINMKPSSLIKAIFLGSVAGIVAGFLPGIGVSQAVMLFSPFLPNTREFLVATASVSGSNEVFSFSSMYMVGNPRSGASVAVKRLFQDFTFFHFLFITSVMLISSAISFYISLRIGKMFPSVISKTDYKKLNIFIATFLILIVYFFTGFYGVLILLTSTSLGIFSILKGIKRVHMMGCLLLPTMLFFSGFYYSVLSLLGM